MKFGLIVILGFCAIAAQAEYRESYEKPNALPQDPIMDRLKEFIENILKEVNKAVYGIIEKAKEIAENIPEQIQGPVVEYDDKLADMYQIYLDKLQDYIDTEKGGECVMQNHPYFYYAFTNARAVIERCETIAQNQAKTLVNGIIDKETSITAQMTEISEIITKCFDDFPNKPNSVILCLTEKANEIKSSINTIFAEAKQGVEDATQQGADIVSYANNCSSTAVSTAQEIIDKIYINLENCVANAVP